MGGGSQAHSKSSPNKKAPNRKKTFFGGRLAKVAFGGWNERSLITQGDPMLKKLPYCRGLWHTTLTNKRGTIAVL